jgi:hypothetical protein
MVNSSTVNRFFPWWGKIKDILKGYKMKINEYDKYISIEENGLFVQFNNIEIIENQLRQNWYFCHLYFNNIYKASIRLSRQKLNKILKYEKKGKIYVCNKSK